MRTHFAKIPRAGAVVALALSFSMLLAAACGSSSDATTPAGTVTPATAGAPGTTIAPVTRDVLASEPEPAAPGQQHWLYRVTIQPGVQLATHHHPGTQMARIESGELTYTIVSGTVGVARNGATEATEQVSSGDVVLHPGDSVYENESLVHHAKNTGTVPTVIILASLLAEGEPLSINVEG